MNVQYTKQDSYTEYLAYKSNMLYFDNAKYDLNCTTYTLYINASFF